MIRNAARIIGAAAALLVSAPATAQSAQDELDARNDRALTAGYKALMLCSALANAERNGTTRTPESVMEWELVGIQAPLDTLIADLPHTIARDPATERVAYVAVTWTGAMPPRVAMHRDGHGCFLTPPGIGLDEIRSQASAPVPDDVNTAKILGTFTFKSTPSAARNGLPQRQSRFEEVFNRAVGDGYGEGTRTTVVEVSGPDWSEGRYAKGFDLDTPQRTWSVAKSIAATLIGAAVQRKEADVHASAGLGLGETDPRRAISIDHLLRMASGRYSDTPGNRTDPLYFGGSTVEETALHWPLVHTPGTVYRYANNDTLAAVEAIEDTFGQHPPAALFAKLGMHHTVAETDWQGSYILSSQVWSTARDLARLGQLYLDDGVLPNGERILPKGWLEYVSTPSGPQPEGEFGYGAGFWLLNKSEGIPPDTIAAMGNRGQFIIIVPKMNVVIVRRGEDPAGTRFDIAAFTRDVLEPLGE